MGATRALLVVLFAGSVGAWSRGVNAEILEFTDPAEWEAAVGTFATIDFTDFPEFTIITTQYQALGVTFTDGDDFTRVNPSAFVNDGWGLSGGLDGDIDLSFETPQRWIAVDFPGVLRILLFNDGRLIDFTSIFSAGPDHVGGFGGIVSTEPFDAVILTDPGDDFVFIDDLHFGVPAPASIWILALAGIWHGRCRRRCRAQKSWN